MFIPSPPKKLKLVPKLTSYTLELSSPIVIGLSEPGVVTEPPNAIASPFIVIDEFASLAFSIEPANCVFETPPAFIVTAPDDTSKSALANEAIPLLEVDASSPAIVISSSLTVVSIPSPPENVKVEPVVNESFEPLSAASVNDVLIDVEPPNATDTPFIVIDEFANLAFAIEPASCVFVTPPDLIVTSPDDTEKSSELNEAIPLLDVEASSPDIVNMLPVIAVSTPSPPIILKLVPKATSNSFEDSSPIVIEELEKAELGMFVIVELFPSMFATNSEVVIDKLPDDAPVNVPVPTINLSALSSKPIKAFTSSPLSITIPASPAALPVLP